MNMPLIIIGTPSKAWFDPALALANKSNRADQDRFRQSLDFVFGMDSHGAPLNGIRPQEISKSMLSGLPSLPAKSMLTDLRACWLGKGMVAVAEHSQILAFYSSPEDFLSHLPEESDPLQALEFWKESARCLLDLIRSHRSSITLLSVEECMLASGQFKSLLEQKFSIDSWEIPAQPEANAVRLALGKMHAQSNPQVASLLAELDAASHPLAGDLPPRIPMLQALEAAWKHLGSESEPLKAAVKQKLALENQLSEFKKSLASAEASVNDLQTIENKYKEAVEENELLFLQLHQVQEELEHYFLENRRLEKERLAASGFEARLLHVEGLRIGHCHDAMPHRHLDFTLDQARLGERDLGSIRIRLVEHNGRSGLLLFQGYSAESAPLHHWKSSGEEDDAPFMLIVPQDDSGRDALVAAPTSDLLFLRESALLLAGELHAAIQHGIAQHKREWAGIAKRFIDLADDIPQRLHYDDVVARAREDKARQFTLTNAWTAARGLIPSLEFIWKDHTIELLRPADGELPLTNWPIDEAARPIEKWTLDLNPRSDWGQHRKVWAGFTSKDREFLLLLIAELPNFAHHLAAQHPELKLDQKVIRKQCKTMFARARALATGRKPKRLLGLIPI